MKLSKQITLFIFTSLIWIMPFKGALSAQKHVPRTIVILHHSKYNDNIIWSTGHLLAEMPLNHLGLKVVHHDLAKGLPKIAHNPDVRGVLSWLPTGAAVADPIAYLEWAEGVVDAGKKFVILGSPGFRENQRRKPTPTVFVNKFMRKLGITYADEWVSLTYDMDVYKSNPRMVGFERKIESFKPPFERIVITNQQATSHLSFRRGKDSSTESHIVVTSPNGGMVLENYAIFVGDLESYKNIKKWFIDPFEFFRTAFQTDDLPKPDTTTLNGRRIYYSHIDGDGWNNISQMEEDKDKDILASQVIYDRVITQYPDLPVTVAPIAADLDPKWVAKKGAQEVARRLFALPNVEVGSHTYSHPFYWAFFKDGNWEKEKPFLDKYNAETWNQEDWKARLQKALLNKRGYKGPKPELSSNYDIPRAFAKEPFDITKEIKGSVDFINQFAPKGKKVEIMQWSGDTQPFAKALELCEEVNVLNINGGDSRFDRDYPSYAWVSPLGRKVGKYRQIYASNSNENTYTDLWQGRYFGFRYLVRTIRNTETPWRIKPFNVYYHMYSGEKDASLTALLNNLEYARASDIIPVTTSEFARVANGFYKTRITLLSPDRWAVQNNGATQTIRFDRSSDKSVDFSKSKGVIGQRHYQGSLYVHLDQQHKVCVIALKKNNDFSEPSYEATPYLIESRWRIWNYRKAGQLMAFKAQGFGNGEMLWHVPQSGGYTIQIIREGKIIHQQKGKTNSYIVRTSLPPMSIETTDVVMRFGEKA